MKILRDSAFYLFHFIVLAFALNLLLFALIPVHAQNSVERELDRRITSIENLNLDHRLTVIETLLNDLKDESLWHKGSTIGTGLLILERGVWALKKKNDKEEEND